MWFLDGIPSLGQGRLCLGRRHSVLNTLAYGYAYDDTNLRIAHMC